MDEAFKRRCTTELVVFLEEECGYRYWIWFPRLQLTGFVDWWSNQENISEIAVGLQSPYSLPGELYLAESEAAVNFWYDSSKNPHFCKAWINSEFDSYLITCSKELVVDRAFPMDRLPQTRDRFSRYLS